ncbi:hypothetical protein D3C84_1205100 [compost metagenome]
MISIALGIFRFGRSASSDMMLTVSKPRKEKQSSAAPDNTADAVISLPNNGPIVNPDDPPLPE